MITSCDVRLSHPDICEVTRHDLRMLFSHCQSVCWFSQENVGCDRVNRASGWGVWRAEDAAGCFLCSVCPPSFGCPTHFGTSLTSGLYWYVLIFNIIYLFHVFRRSNKRHWYLCVVCVACFDLADDLGELQPSWKISKRGTLTSATQEVNTSEGGSSEPFFEHSPQDPDGPRYCDGAMMVPWWECWKSRWCPV